MYRSSYIKILGKLYKIAKVVLFKYWELDTYIAYRGGGGGLTYIMNTR